MDLWTVCGALRTPIIVIVNMKSIYIYTRLGLVSFVSLNCLMSDNFILNFPVTKPSITGTRLWPTFMVFGAAKFIVVDGHIVWNHIFSEDFILVLFFIVGVFCHNNGFDAIFLQAPSPTACRYTCWTGWQGPPKSAVGFLWPTMSSIYFKWLNVNSDNAVCLMWTPYLLSYKRQDNGFAGWVNFFTI